jgi:hypothetical protein
MSNLYDVRFITHRMIDRGEYSIKIHLTIEKLPGFNDEKLSRYKQILLRNQ